MGRGIAIKDLLSTIETIPDRFPDELGDGPGDDAPEGSLVTNSL